MHAACSLHGHSFTTASHPPIWPSTGPFNTTIISNPKLRSCYTRNAESPCQQQTVRRNSMHVLTLFSKDRVVRSHVQYITITCCTPWYLYLGKTTPNPLRSLSGTDSSLCHLAVCSCVSLSTTYKRRCERSLTALVHAMRTKEARVWLTSSAVFIWESEQRDSCVLMS